VKEGFVLPICGKTFNMFNILRGIFPKAEVMPEYLWLCGSKTPGDASPHKHQSIHSGSQNSLNILVHPRSCRCQRSLGSSEKISTVKNCNGFPILDL
jgi:hypothetical protein